MAVVYVYHLKIKYDQDKFSAVFYEVKRPVSFPLEDKHVMNEHHVVGKKSLRHSEKMSTRGVFQCTT